MRIWNIPPRFCIIKQKSTVLPSTGSARTRLLLARFCRAKTRPDGGRPVFRLRHRQPGVARPGATAAPARPWSCSRKPALCWRPPWPRRARSLPTHHAPSARTCAPSGRGRAVRPLRLQTRPISTAGFAEQQRGPGHRPPREPTARWRMSAPAGSAC